MTIKKTHISTFKYYYRWLKSFYDHRFKNGYCPICEEKVFFYRGTEWLRDNYYCLNCFSIPRERALINTLSRFYPNWRNLIIHESSPGNVSSEKLRNECLQYSSSQYLTDVPFGQVKEGIKSESLEALTFEDESFDLIVTQDVFEHIMHPEKAFKEIHRVLKIGGAHIFSMPWYPKLHNTVKRARIKDGEIIYLEDKIFHGNPVDEKGSLVTYDWGLDFSNFILNASGLQTITYLQENKNMGIEAEFLEIFVSIKNE